MFEDQLIEKVEICNEILSGCRNELYLNMRFLDVALHSLAPEPSMALPQVATNGQVFRYNPEFLIGQFKIGNVPSTAAISTVCSIACLAMSGMHAGRKILPCGTWPVT